MSGHLEPVSELHALNHEGDPALSDSLSPRERELLLRAIDGMTDQGIANDLGISAATVSTYWGRVRIKFGAKPRTELVADFVRAELSRTMAQLAASEGQLRTVLESVPVGVILVNLEGELMFANGTFRRLIGLPNAIPTRESIRAAIHPDDRDRVVENWERCRREATDFHSDYRYLRPNGSVVWARASGNDWHDAAGPGGRVAVVEDVTASHDAEIARIEIGRRFQTMLELVPEAVVTHDASHRIVEFNPGAERMFGYRADEAIGRPLSILIPARFHASHERQVSRFGEPGTDVARAMNARTKVIGLRCNGEEFPCEASILRQTIAGQRLFTAIIRDATWRLPPLEEERETALA